MANGGRFTLSEVQAIMRLVEISATGRYLGTRVKHLVDALLEHYNRSRPAPSYPIGYDQADIEAVFGA